VRFERVDRRLKFGRSLTKSPKLCLHHGVEVRGEVARVRIALRTRIAILLARVDYESIETQQTVPTLECFNYLRNHHD